MEPPPKFFIIDLGDGVDGFRLGRLCAAGSCNPWRWTRRFVVAKVGRRLQVTNGPAKIFDSTAPFLLADALQDQELRLLNLLGCSGGVYAQKEHSAALFSWHEVDSAGTGAKVRSRGPKSTKGPIRDKLSSQPTSSK